ncbi:MAG: VWA domain-containing protein [Bacteroidia bacterium]|nr:VWA domain-containing protein [Bacteroidia bacterium]HMU76634.1 VWA domain-containing protein [Bacteroidia bacterium]HMW10188.1 VWA domain-containing protein [Bacteroidia bacterium]HMX96694.1 VWA domain-containing protein [Bacteroidia bacterium]HMY13142.1 VWA domain-containing protein [Bacteroidia bacterium]
MLVIKSCVHNFRKLFFLIAFFIVFTSTVKAQKNNSLPLTRIEFLFDASQSMYAQWQTNTRFEIAKKLLSEMVDSLDKITNVEMALRVYGHTKKFPPQDCDDTRLEVPFGKNTAYLIKKRLSEISPSGTTPIAQSLNQCGNDFPADPARNIIILITDGIEECNGDPCAVSLMLQQKGIILKPFVIGLGLSKEYKDVFNCVGNYYDAVDETGFRTVFNVVISQALNNTTIQVNLLDEKHRPTETNVNMTFYDTYSGALRYNFVHTLNAKGLPDTLLIDPLGTYDIVVNTIPPVRKDSNRIVAGKHNTIGIDCPQGDLFLKFDGTSDYKNLQCIVRKKGDSKTLHVQAFNTTTRYLTGDYDLEVLCLPRMLINDVNIAQSKTTTVQIPNPGMATFQTVSAGYGSVYQEKDNKLNWVCNLNENNTHESILLQPGNYRVVFRPKISKEAIYTVEKTFRITSGSGITVNINK